MAKNEIDVLPEMDGELSLLNEIQSRKQTFCSLSAETQNDKLKIYNLTMTPKHRVADFINKEIIVRDVFVEMIELFNETSGDTVIAPRIVLIDINGEGYASVSNGVYNAVKRLIQLIGAPTWKEGVKLEVKQIKKGNNSILTLNAVVE